MNKHQDKIEESFNRLFLNALALPINLFALYAWGQVIEKMATTDSFGIAIISFSASLALVCAPAYNILAACIMLMQAAWYNGFNKNTGEHDANS